MEVFIGKQKLFSVDDESISKDQIQALVADKLHLSSQEFYLLLNGKRLQNQQHAVCGRIHVILSVLGGKGGFGSMLRAIGAQIEKTTNREACRDLSGRRLRDINEEQRLKKWVTQQADREKEAKEKKIKKLEKLCETPKHEFKDEVYDQERSALPEKVEDAVLKGLEISGKRKSEQPEKVAKKKKKLWMDSEFDELSSCGSDEDEAESTESRTGSSKSGEESPGSSSSSSSGIVSSSSSSKSNENSSTAATSSSTNDNIHVVEAKENTRESETKL